MFPEDLLAGRMSAPARPEPKARSALQFGGLL